MNLGPIALSGFFIGVVYARFQRPVCKSRRNLR